MKLFAVLLGALAFLTGVAGGLQAYTVSAATDPATSPVSVPHHHPSPQVVRPGVVVKWAPCRPPAVRQGRACVTHVTRTVTVPAPVATVPASSTAVRSPQVSPTRTVQAVAGEHENGDHESGPIGGAEHDGAEHHGGEHDD
jgi:hypothetical protein